MQFKNFSFLLLAGVGAQAFKITIYNNNEGCQQQAQTVRREITGNSISQCYIFDEGMPGTDCAQFFDESNTDEGGCSGHDSLLPKSFTFENDGAQCWFYTEPECLLPVRTADGELLKVQEKTCLTSNSGFGGKQVRAFQCDSPFHPVYDKMARERAGY